MLLSDAGTIDAFPAKLSSPGTALAIIQYVSLPIPSPGHHLQSHDVLGQAPSALKQLSFGTDVRKISPHEMSEFSLVLYAAGIISFDDYSALSEHPELNPHFNRTIGALTKETAKPDIKRDLVIFWEEKMNFAKRYPMPDKSNLEQAKRIVWLMRYLSRRARMHL